MNIEDIIHYTQKTPENTNPNILRSMLNSLFKENTGDCTTCEVTYVNNSEDSYMLYVAHAYNDESESYINNAGLGTTETLSVILYKGQALACFLTGNMPPSADISVTGAIEYDEKSDNFVITGDGTITISE